MQTIKPIIYGMDFGISKIPIGKLLATSIRMSRAKLGWSQAELSRQADVHHNYIGKVESGQTNIGITNLEKLASAMGIPIWQLLKRAEELLNE